MAVIQSARIVIWATFAIVVYFLVVKKYKYVASFVIILDNVEPQIAWEYHSNFSNIKRMNPTIFDYEILTGTGDSKSQKYSVLYKETLVHTSYVTNENMGVYEILPSKNGQPFRILSTHDTCQFGFCLHSTHTSIFEDGEEKNTTIVSDFFEYECQLLLSLLCKTEFMAQRQLIYGNMREAHKVSSDKA